MLKFSMLLLLGIKCPVIVSYRDSKSVVSKTIQKLRLCALENLGNFKGNPVMTKAQVLKTEVGV